QCDLLSSEARNMTRDSSLFHVHSVGPASLSIVRRPRGGDGLADDIRTLKTAGVHRLVSMLTPEEEAAFDLTAEAECCRAVGIDYLSVPVADFGIPADSTPFEQAVTN